MVDAGLAAGLSSGRSADVILACGDRPADYLGALVNELTGFPATAPWPDGAISADGRVVDAAGLRVAALGGCLRYSEGPNQYTERQQARRARRLRRLARRRRLLDRRGVGVLDRTPGSGLTELHGGYRHAV
jgi:hypothetical protein